MAKTPNPKAGFISRCKQQRKSRKGKVLIRPVRTIKRRTSDVVLGFGHVLGVRLALLAHQLLNFKLRGLLDLELLEALAAGYLRFVDGVGNGALNASELALVVDLARNPAVGRDVAVGLTHGAIPARGDLGSSLEQASLLLGDSSGGFKQTNLLREGCPCVVVSGVVRLIGVHVERDNRNFKLTDQTEFSFVFTH